MEKLYYNNKIFSYYEYETEENFEKRVVEYANKIFGDKSIYIDLKKRIGVDNILSIPDGYLIDFSFEHDPKLYIIENELAVHDAYRHIGQQILRFAISYKTSGRKIKRFLLADIINDKTKKEIVDDAIKKAGYRNIDNLLEDIIFEKEVGCIVIIDKNSDELENVLSQLTIKTDIIELQTYIFEDEFVHKFIPFQQDIKFESKKNTNISPDELNTIVVPARQEGFNEVFIEENCWYSIRMSSSMIDRVKYIAAYQTSPISAITHYAEVIKIDKYKDTNKYILYFKETAKEIEPIKLPKNNSGLAPQSPRYTTLDKLLAAKTLEEVFN
ncbi:MAG: hypothetical protein ACOCRK_07355 [bacterium]